MRNPYDILGVKPTVSEADLRKAFRKLAKQCHPDLNPGNAAAETRFKEINAAYDLLSDPAKRARFDRGEIDAEGRETFSHAYANAGANTGGATRDQAGHFSFHFGGGGADDLFAEFFGHGRRGGGGQFKGQDRHHTVTVDFLDAANGAKRRLVMDGGRSLDITIPAGIKDGQVLRLKGQGESGFGGHAGDLLVKVSVAPDKLFRRVGDDIHCDIPVTLSEAVGGARITVPTIAGKVAVTVPPRSNTGTILRLKGKGIKGGDQYVALKVVLPPAVDDDLARLAEEWGRRHPFDPRAGL